MTENNEDLVDNIDLNLDPIDEKSELAENSGLDKLPEIHEEGWTEYVLSQLSPSELQNGRPRVNGLLRFARKYFTKVFFTSRTEKYQFNEQDVAVVETSVYCANEQSRLHDENCYVGIAECSRSNTNGVFINYPFAVAQTRSLGRALKFALGLDVHTAEEISEDAKPAEQQEEKINTQQINMMRNLSKRNNVNIAKMIDDEYPKWNKNIENVPKNIASSLISKLSHIGNKSVKLEDKYKGFVDF